ncbi:hypothetical protein LOAG_04157 [Loa loa]|uniref:Uncharacterized protein n=1 Tax=Loa loa TaxID=7209 RepID=A0A1S0U4M9_LOALO|nr:hypothetical protein LOAG_04157 [Loa loa]EFO24324.1 hypothetical protein LOAG_04157 [Loa loa]
MYRDIFVERCAEPAARQHKVGTDIDDGEGEEEEEEEDVRDHTRCFCVVAQPN